MNLSVEQVLNNLVTGNATIEHCYFSNKGVAAIPPLAYQVNFPRLEVIIEGTLQTTWSDNNQSTKKYLSSGDVLFIDANSWNKPIWTYPTTTLSILFGKQQLGFSLLRWNGSELSVIEQLNTERRGPRTGSFIIQTLTELAMNYDEKRSNTTANLLIRSLLSNSLELLTSQFSSEPKTTSLFITIRQYIDSNFAEKITRESLAEQFHISPNYLSSLFQKEGNIGLNEYIVYTRLEHAKSLLKRHDLNIKEIASAAGFDDSNYFCRIFKKKTDRTPSEYRKQYHSKISHKS